MEIHLNYGAILAAGLLNVLIGMLWYSVLFGKAWIHLMGFDRLSSAEKKKMMEKAKPGYFFAFGASLLMSFCMGHEVQSGENFYHVTGMAAGLMAGFWIWLGFLVTSQLNSVLWEGKSPKLYFINVGYYLASYLLTGALLALWP
jgi:hypothetical protein